MAEFQRDLWSDWLLDRRFGGNTDEMKVRAGLSQSGPRQGSPAF